MSPIRISWDSLCVVFQSLSVSLARGIHNAAFMMLAPTELMMDCVAITAMCDCLLSTQCQQPAVKYVCVNETVSQIQVEKGNIKSRVLVSQSQIRLLL